MARELYGLSTDEKRELFDAGFTTYEINEFHTAVDPAGNRQKRKSFPQDVWQEMLRERRVRVQRLKDDYFKRTGKQMGRWQISRQFNLKYFTKKGKHRKADPFDWLKLAYQRVRGISSDAAQLAASRLRDFPGNRPYKQQASFD